jgi:hypothetical protein
MSDLISNVTRSPKKILSDLSFNTESQDMLTSCHKREIYFYRLVQSAASTYRLSAELKLFRIQLENIYSEKKCQNLALYLVFFYLKINKYYNHCLSFK